jgi:hypothetical protein
LILLDHHRLVAGAAVAELGVDLEQLAVADLELVRHFCLPFRGADGKASVLEPG